MSNIFMIPTGNSSLTFWRMQCFVEAAYKHRLGNFQNSLWFKDLNGQQPWEKKLTDDTPAKHVSDDSEKYDPLFVRAFIPMIESGCIGADAVVFQAVHEEGAIELFDAIRDKFPHLPILTEIDDNILSVPTYNEAHGAFLPGAAVRDRVLHQIRNSDGVIVSTSYLREVFSEYNKNIWVIQNSIDFELWGRARRKARPGIRIGWAGGSGHEGDFKIIEKAIKNIVARHKDVKFVFVNGPARSGLPDFLKGIPQIEHHAIWEPIKKYPSMIAGLDFDIGIAPLIDSAFNRGKSNLKWLEGAALGYPVVASNVGHFKETLTHGKDALLANSEAEFERHLESLIVDKKYRKQIGTEAHRKAYEDFNVVKTTKLYSAVLDEAISLKKGLVPAGVQ